MSVTWLTLAFVIVAVLVGGCFVGMLMLQRARQRQAEQATAQFHKRREWLEAEFLSTAARSGRPRGLAWMDCDFDDDAYLARDRSSGELRALVGVTIRFEAVVGGGMEEVEAVQNLRSGTAVFRYDDGRWRTDGRAVFNLTPCETIRYFSHELEPVA